MEKHNLVVLKTTQPFFWEEERLEPNKVYRCLIPTESGSDEDYMINALWFTKEEYEMYFETAYDRVIRDWKALGFITADGKQISFAEFKRRIDVHTYGKQINNLRIGFGGISKENFYKFYPSVDANKLIQLRDMYNMYEYTVNGNMYYLDNHSIQFGTFGIGVSYIRKS